MSDGAAPTWIVIMGAAVRPGGEPSGALRHRVEGAIAAARRMGGRVMFMPSGGVGRHPPAEAEVMARLLLAAGVADGEIVREEQAHDTLSSVENCARLLRREAAAGQVYIATDGFHRLRCVLLFRLYGVPAQGLRLDSARRRGGTRRWLYYVMREAVATPWDAALALLRRPRQARR